MHNTHDTIEKHIHLYYHHHRPSYSVDIDFKLHYSYNIICDTVSAYDTSIISKNQQCYIFTDLLRAWNGCLLVLLNIQFYLKCVLRFGEENGISSLFIDNFCALFKCSSQIWTHSMRNEMGNFSITQKHVHSMNGKKSLLYSNASRWSSKRLSSLVFIKWRNIFFGWKICR